MLSMLHGALLFRCIAIIVKLSIAEHLEGGAKSSSELAILTGMHEKALCRLLRLLVSFGVFSENKEKCFELNELGALLVSSNPESLRPMVKYLDEEGYVSKACDNLFYSIETGGSAFEEVFSLPFFEYLKQNKSSHENFNQYMVGKFTPIFKSVINTYDFSRFRSIIDIGGGNGSFMLEILNANKEIKGYVFDLPELKNAASVNITNATLSDRCQFIGGDFFKDIPRLASIYLMKSIIHDWSDEDALKILKNCRKGMDENSKLLIVEQIIFPNRKRDAIKFSDMMMLVLFGSKERTEKEFKSLLRQARLKINTIIQTDTEFSIIEAIGI